MEKILLLSVLLVSSSLWTVKAQDNDDQFPDNWQDNDDKWYDHELEFHELGIANKEIKEAVSDEDWENDAALNASVERQLDDLGDLNEPDEEFQKAMEDIEVNFNEPQPLDLTAEDIDTKVQDEIEKYINDEMNKENDAEENDENEFDQIEDNRAFPEPENEFNDSKQIIENEENLGEIKRIANAEDDVNDFVQKEEYETDSFEETLENLFNLKNEEEETKDLDKDIKVLGDEVMPQAEIPIAEPLSNNLKLRFDEPANDQKEDFGEIDENDFDEIADFEINKDIFDETKQILEEDKSNLEYESFDANIQHEDNLEAPKESLDEVIDDDQNNADIMTFEEMKQILNEGVDQVEIKEIQENQSPELNVDLNEYLIDDDDADSVETVNKAYADLQNDLDKLFETWDKLQEIEEDSSEESEEVIYQDIFDYEEKEGRPFREENILQQRAYEDFNGDLEELFEENGNEFADNAEVDSDSVQAQSDFEDLFQNPEPIKEVEEEIPENIEDSKIVVNEPVESDDLVDLSESDQGDLFPNPDILDEIIKESQESEHENKNIENQLPKQENVEDITSAELNDLMVQFAVDHAEDLDIHSESFDKQIAPTFFQINEEATVITSPDYPNVYPTNNIVDWVIDGDGMGIELNITDFSVNGFLGDYLLIKPGGVDESGHDGLIFSYHLSSERRFRFLDVNRMFIRFQANAGIAFSRGFQLSVRIITPPSTEGESPVEPEELLQPPEETITVFLAGVSPQEFLNISEEFRLVVADMASLYINTNGLDLGEKTTAEVTQITQTGVCNINWPGFERCVAVTFGVPLDTDAAPPGLTADQLTDMWDGYVFTDPFAARLNRLGITEFAIPNDGTTLLVWLLIGLGVTISAAMLALALWRWSCIEEYMRMPAYGDTDSIISDQKKGLDLYPTPHQTLPPLYDADYAKYDDTTRVDMGGFANKSYARDELYDLESDDDVIGPLPGKNNNRFSDGRPSDINKDFCSRQ